MQNLLHSILGPRLVAADFDNDQRPDGAVLTEAGQFEGRQLFRVKLHFTLGQQNDLTFQSSETGLVMSALDVNQDGTPDLVVEQVFTHKRLQVWLNDGHGRFRPARVEDFPPVSEGPCRWQSPLQSQACLVLGLPSRVGLHYLVQSDKVTGYNSSSPDWRVCSEPPAAQSGSLAIHSPRSPPALQSL